MCNLKFFFEILPANALVAVSQQDCFGNVFKLPHFEWESNTHTC